MFLFSYHVAPRKSQRCDEENCFLAVVFSDFPQIPLPQDSQTNQSNSSFTTGSSKGNAPSLRHARGRGTINMTAANDCPVCCRPPPLSQPLSFAVHASFLQSSAVNCRNLHARHRLYLHKGNGRGGVCCPDSLHVVNSQQVCACGNSSLCNHCHGRPKTHAPYSFAGSLPAHNKHKHGTHSGGEIHIAEPTVLWPSMRDRLGFRVHCQRTVELTMLGGDPPQRATICVLALLLAWNLIPASSFASLSLRQATRQQMVQETENLIRAEYKWLK